MLAHGYMRMPYGYIPVTPRRDVPDLATGILYIDVGDRSVRRKRHSFHHELWHMVDYRAPPLRRGWPPGEGKGEREEA